MTEELGSIQLHVKVSHRLGTTDLLFEEVKG
jgi:hypothetical protein